jgi:hypothetical protein
MLSGALLLPKSDVLEDETCSRTCIDSCPPLTGAAGLLGPFMWLLGVLSATASSYSGGGSSRSGERSDSSSSRSRYLLVDPLYALSLSLEEAAGV